MKDTYCPKCRTHLILSDNIVKSKFLKCNTRKSSFENPHYPKPKREPIFDEHDLTEIKELSSKIFTTKNLIWGTVILSVIFLTITYYDNSQSKICEEESDWIKSEISRIKKDIQDLEERSQRD